MLSTDGKEIANGFNQFFAGTVNRLVNTFGRLQNSGSSFLYPKNKLLRRFQFEEAKEVSVCSQLKKLKTSRAAGIDELPARLLKDSAGVVAKPLTTLIYVSLFTGLVPSEWKSARVIPLFKGEDRGHG